MSSQFWFASSEYDHRGYSRNLLASPEKKTISFPRSADADSSIISGGSFAQLVVEDDDIISH